MLLAVPAAVFIDVIAGRGIFFTRDVSLYHVPMRRMLSMVVGAGEFPYWNPFISAGQPLAANPAHQLFYPPTWLMFLPGQFLYAFQWHVLIHVFIATTGTYALLRSLGTSRAAGVIGALSFGLGGLLASTLSLFPFLFSVSWLPLVCMFTRRLLMERRFRDFALASSCFAMQFLVGEPMTIAQTGLLLGAYALCRPSRFRDLGLVAAISVSALLISAVQTLPAIDHARDSVRARGFTFAEVAEWSTPPERLVELVYPERFGWSQGNNDDRYGRDLYEERQGPFFFSIYLGLAATVMCVAGVAARLRGWPLYLAASALSVVLALGRHTPLLEWLYDAGVARSIRFPEKFLILGLFSSAIFGALALDEWLRGNRTVRWSAAAMCALVAVAALILSLPQSAWRATALAFIVAFASRLRRPVAAVLAFAFVVGDLAPRVGHTAPRTSPALYAELPKILSRLTPDLDQYRILHLGNWRSSGRVVRYQGLSLRRQALAGYMAAAYGIRSAIDSDYDLTALATSDDFARAAWRLSERMPSWLNYVTVMANIRYVLQYRDYDEALAEARGDVEAMVPVRLVEGAANPRYYFASAVATARDRAEFVKNVTSRRYDPRTAFVADPPFQPARGRVLRIEEAANWARLDVEAEGVAFLVMSVTAHKYWTVVIDGIEVPPIVTNLAFQGVVVPRGRHVVEMRYHNPLIAAGAAVSIATMLVMLFAGWRSRQAITMRDL